MKKTVLFPLIGALAILSLSNFVSRDPDGKAGYTGAPGEQACNNSGCHTSFALNSGGGVLDLTSNIPTTGYVPGETYQLHLKVKKTASHLFGFGLEALTAAGQNAGTLIITETAKTWTKTRTVNGVSRITMTHKKNAGNVQDSVTFNFNWKAPASGDVHFYFAGLAANSNGNDTGDYVYSANKTVSQQVSAATDISDIKVLQVFPNPVKDKAILRYTLNDNANVRINLFAADGRLLKTWNQGARGAGQHEDTLVLTGAPTATVCYLELKTEKGSVTKKIVIE